METPKSSGSSSGKATSRDKHIAEMQRLAQAIRKTDSPKLKRDYTIRLRRMSHELKIYDAYHKGEKK